ncbi:recombinase family protein [Methanomassiliicoccus luminyensis]|nr:recombinase family protein [Methanomassiliicoccus luminyensis]
MDMTQDRQLRAALYARVSTDDQGQDPETQLFRLRQVCKHREYEIVGEYVEYASGKDPDRKVLKVLLKDAKQGKLDLILVTRLDRMMRSQKHFFEVLEQLHGWNVRFECSEQDFNTKGAFGKFTMSLLSDLAELERNLTLERSAEGTVRAKAQGKLCHRPKGAKDRKPRKPRSDRGIKRGSRSGDTLINEPAGKTEGVTYY